jgi:hypothetical protein
VPIPTIECSLCGNRLRVATMLAAIRNPPKCDPRRCLRCGSKLTRIAFALAGIVAASSLGACSSVVPSTPIAADSGWYDERQVPYGSPPRRYYDDPPSTVADAAPVSQPPTVTAPPSWQHDLETAATGAVVGMTGPKIIKRAFGNGGLMGGAETGAAVAGGALAGRTAGAGLPAITGSAEAGTAAVGAAEGAEIGAAALGAAEAAEAVEGAEILEGLLLLFAF